jgi:hypothetical protein
MFRYFGLIRVYREYRLPGIWILATPYGFWYMAENLLGTAKYTARVLNSMLLFPIPVFNFLAIASIFIQYCWVKWKILRKLNYETRKCFLGLLPEVFFYYLWKGEL